MNIDDIKYFLQSNGWKESRPREGITRYTSPESMRIEPPITIDIPQTGNNADLERYVPRILETLAQIYDLSVSAIGHLVNPPINCNTQLYRMVHVPPFMFKTIIPFPYFTLFSTSFFHRINRYRFKWANSITYNTRFKQGRKWLDNLKLWWFRYFGYLKPVVFLLVIIQLYFLFIEPYIGDSYKFLWTLLESFRYVFIFPNNLSGKLLFILFLILYFKDVWNFTVFLVKKIIEFIRNLAGKRFRRIADFLYNVGWFSFTKNPDYILRALLEQYPEGAGFVIHTVDLEFMAAGKPPANFNSQVQELVDVIIKKQLQARIFPFLFIDPRRIAQDPQFFQATEIDHTVVLKDCLVKDCLEGNKGVRFKGFKMNPALGYYPFDEALLPVWKYAADNKIPVYVNCNDDVLYYRGFKKREWDFHPVFKESTTDMSRRGSSFESKTYQPLLLPQVDNREFSRNFLHPLNYLCLLYEPLLRQIVSKCSSETKKWFGFRGDDTPMLSNLTNVRLCFSHFGGAGEWEKFMEHDTQQHSSNEVLRRPNEGINFISHGGLNSDKLLRVWKEADWYSVISSLMLQYPNVYADTSHVPNNPQVYPLFKMTMQNAKLRSKILLGSDFYMIHRHKSERAILAEIGEDLSAEELMRVFETNPRHFLGVL